MMSPKHWEAFGRLLNLEAAKRNLQEPQQIVNLIPELWDDLKAEVSAERAADTLELERTKLAVSQTESNLVKQKERQRELEGKVDGGR